MYTVETTGIAKTLFDEIEHFEFLDVWLRLKFSNGKIALIKIECVLRIQEY